MPDLDQASIQHDLFEGLRIARERGRAVIVTHSEELAELPDLIELFVAAEQRGDSRFLAMRASDATALLGLGCCDQIVVKDSAELENLTANARRLLADVLPSGAARSAAKLLGGIAFEAWASSARDPAWRRFGPARFTLPDVLIERRGARVTSTWALRVTPEDDEAELMHRSQRRLEKLLEKPVARSASSTRIEAPPDDDLERRYTGACQRVIEAIDAGKCEKVVLADFERLRVHGARPTEPVLRALCESQPGCLTFAQGFDRSTFLGSTPERLVSLQGQDVRTAAIAGTSLTGARLQDSSKDRAEHDYVVRAIESVLAELCDTLEVPAEPGLLGAGRAQHLVSEVRGRLREPAHVLDLVKRLHPTPAVGGTPRSAALTLIRAHERFDRGWYAGPIGWLDAKGDGEFHVALRCGLLADDELRLFAGAGIVSGSRPADEAAETRLKLTALREALERACAR